MVARFEMSASVLVSPVERSATLDVNTATNGAREATSMNVEQKLSISMAAAPALNVNEPDFASCTPKSPRRVEMDDFSTSQCHVTALL